jgi:ribosome biogenesis protein ENP2
MKVASANGCKVYNLSSGKSFPQFLSESKKRALAKDDEYRRRLDLIQDFEVATAAQCIRMTSDGEHIVITGTYPPCVRVYTLNDLSLKFHRGLTCEVVAMETLSEGYEKLVFLQMDRTLNFHAPYGTHYSLRVPKFGRHLAYHWDSCDLFVASAGDEVYRLNLEAGQFREPFKLGFQGCNRVHINPCHPLLACGGETAACEFWDMRYRKSVASLQVSADKSTEITALKFDADGLTLAVGTSTGQCFLYDIRSSKPFYQKDHQYGEPMVDISFHHGSRSIISSDKKLIKIWNRDESSRGQLLTNIETSADINDLVLVKDQRGETGMLMAAGEQSKIMTYFVPQLGPAPRWCSFLESLTEELEESSNSTVYEDFKFLTQAEVEELGASGLIGTAMLKSYMHGYFMEMKLYSKLRAVSKPFEYEEHRKKSIQAKIDAKRASRITPRKRVKESDAMDFSKEVVSDPRFAALTREEFQVDKDSEAYRLRHPINHPSSGKAADQELGLRKRQLEEDEDDLLPQRNRTAMTFIPKSKSSTAKRQYDDDEDDDRFESVDIDDEEDEEEILKSSQRMAKQRADRSLGSKSYQKPAPRFKVIASTKRLPKMFAA